jgi:hypothetical protein
MQNFWRDRYELADLPLWRKALLACGMALFCAVGGTLFTKETEICTSAPGVAVPAAGQVYPVHVNHGYVRYVTQNEADTLEFWRAATPPSIVTLFVAAALLLLTYRDGRS